MRTHLGRYPTLFLLLFLAFGCGDSEEATQLPTRTNVEADFNVPIMAAPPAQANAAVVIKDGFCFAPGVDAEGNPDGSLGGTSDDITLVENGNKVILSCKIPVTNLSGQGQVFRGFACTIFTPLSGEVVTMDTHVAVSASGVNSFTCKYTK